MPPSQTRNPFPEPLLLTVVLKLSGEQLPGQIAEEGEDSGGVGTSGATYDDDSSRGAGRDSGGSGGSDGGRRGGKGGWRAGGRVPFVLLLKRAIDLVLQPFQALQVSLG